MNRLRELTVAKGKGLIRKFGMDMCTLLNLKPCRKGALFSLASLPEPFVCWVCRKLEGRWPRAHLPLGPGGGWGSGFTRQSCGALRGSREGGSPVR